MLVNQVREVTAVYFSSKFSQLLRDYLCCWSVKGSQDEYYIIRLTSRPTLKYSTQLLDVKKTSLNFMAQFLGKWGSVTHRRVAVAFCAGYGHIPSKNTVGYVSDLLGNSPIRKMI